MNVRYRAGLFNVKGRALLARKPSHLASPALHMKHPGESALLAVLLSTAKQLLLSKCKILDNAAKYVSDVSFCIKGLFHGILTVPPSNKDTVRDRKGIQGHSQRGAQRGTFPPHRCQGAPRLLSSVSPLSLCPLAQGTLFR